MKGNGKSAYVRAQDLVSTSVQDLQSSLPHYSRERQSDVEVICYAVRLCERRGEKTKATLLRRKLKVMERDSPSPRPSPAGRGGKGGA